MGQRRRGTGGDQYGVGLNPANDQTDHRPSGRHSQPLGLWLRTLPKALPTEINDTERVRGVQAVRHASSAYLPVVTAFAFARGWSRLNSPAKPPYRLIFQAIRAQGSRPSR